MYRKKSFDKINLRRKRTSNFDIDINLVISKKYLNVLKILKDLHYFDLLQKSKGLIKLIEGPIITAGKIKYTLKIFLPYKRKYLLKKIILPKKLDISKELFYFLGLSFGDGAGKNRVGIINTNENLLKYTFIFLSKFFNKNEILGSIFVTNKKEMKKIRTYKKKLKALGISTEINIVKNFHARGNVVYSIYVNCQPFAKILYFIIFNIDKIWDKIDQNLKNSFLAGLFDAEGNVNARDKNLRISQQEEKNKSIINEILKQENYHFRYDGANFVIGNRKETRTDDFKKFEKQVLPYLKHENKYYKASLLIKNL